MGKAKFEFVVGSQDLYGAETLKIVESRGREMAAYLSSLLPYPLAYQGIVRTNDDAVRFFKEANFDDDCEGLIIWCHTFSPSKMWINGLSLLQKPYLHLVTQYNQEIPNEGIDMDFMNLNQAAHGDREHGYIAARMRLPEKIIAGHWQDPSVQKRIGKWMKVASAALYSRRLSVMRLGDNMREVAVTEGDKIEAQIRLGWQVNTFPVGEFAGEIAKVGDEEAASRIEEYRKKYRFKTTNLVSVLYQAKEEIALERMLERHACQAFTDNFEDLYGLRQLPGLATQDLMGKGYGFGAEGDWKTAALGAVIKKMGGNGSKGSSFIEAYTYDYAQDDVYTLGAHMLEVDPSIAAITPAIEVHPLGIGGKEAPARLVFEGKEGSATFSSLIDLGGRLRLIVQDIDCVKPTKAMPNLPVARVMWKSVGPFANALECWIRAGGSHHTVLSYDADAESLGDWARIMGIEFVHLSGQTTPEALEHDLFLSDLAWRLRL